MSLQCEKKVERRVIDTGKPLTILSPKSDTPISSIEWYFGKKPIKSSTNLAISFQSVRFIPDYQGEYDIVAELYNETNKIIGVNIFKYNAIGSNYKNISLDKEKQIENIESTKIDSVNEKLDTLSNLDTILNDTNQIKIKKDTIVYTDSNSKNTVNNNEKFNYTIQVYSFPDESEANKKIQKLKIAGFDAYKIEFLHPKYNKTWYRVRVGMFIDFTSANVIAKKIDNHFKINTWIDKLN